MSAPGENSTRLTAVMFLLSASFFHASAATWINPNGGSWASSANWANGVIANGVDVTADFSQLTLTTHAIVTLDGTWTVGNMIFGTSGNTNSWTINPGSGGALTLANSTSWPIITVYNTNANINVALNGITGLNAFGPGTLTLSATNNPGGTLVADGGNLLLNGSTGPGLTTVSKRATLSGLGTVDGSLISSGVVSPTCTAPVGVLTVTSNYTQNANGTLEIDLAGFYYWGTSRLKVAGTANLNGTLNVVTIQTRPDSFTGWLPDCVNNYYTADGVLTNQFFPIVSAGQVVGTFSAVNWSAPPVGEAWNLRYTSNSVLLYMSQIAISSSKPVTNQTVTLTVSADLIGQGCINLANASHGISQQLFFDSKGRVQWTPTQCGEYIFTCGAVSLPVWVTSRKMTFNWWNAVPQQTNVTEAMVTGAGLQPWKSRGIIQTHWAGGSEFKLGGGLGTCVTAQDWVNMWNIGQVDGGLEIDEVCLDDYGSTAANTAVLEACAIERQTKGPDYSINLWTVSFDEAFTSTILANNITLLAEDYYGEHARWWASAVEHNVQNNFLFGIWPCHSTAVPTTNEVSIRADIASIRRAGPSVNGIAIFAGARDLLLVTDRAVGDYYLKPVIYLSVNAGQLDVWNIGNDDAAGFYIQFQNSSGGYIGTTTDLSGLTANSHMYLSIPVGSTRALVVNPGNTANLYSGNNFTINGGSTTATAGSMWPVFSHPPGTYSGLLTVTINCTPGATIYYTTDGSTPTSGSPSSYGAVNIRIPPVSAPNNTTITIKAYAQAPGAQNSIVSSGTYTVVPSASMPYWQNSAGGSWNTIGNWFLVGSQVPNGVEKIGNFSRLALSAPVTVTLDGAKTMGGLSFSDVRNAYGWTLNTGSGGPLTLAVSSGSPTITVSNQTVTIGCVLTGTGGLVKDGAGTLVLTNEDTLANGVIVNGGSLILQRPTAINNYMGGTYTVNAGATLTLDNHGSTLDGGWENPLVINNGTVNITGDTVVSYSSPNKITMTGGTLNWTAGGGFSGAQFNTLASSTTATISGTGGNAYSGTYIFNVARGAAAVDLTVAMPINGSGSSITLNGGGIVQLTGINTYSGATVIDNGTLALAGSYGSIPNTSMIRMANGATLDVSGLVNTFVLQSGQTLSNNVAASGKIKGDLNTGAGTIAVSYANGTPAFVMQSDSVLTLSSGTRFKINNIGTALGAGRYVLISTNGSGATVTGTLPGPGVTVSGGGVAANTSAFLEVARNQLWLVVESTVSGPIWINYIGGSWTNGVNWLCGTMAKNAGVTANFGALTLNSAPTVTLDGALIIGGLKFGDVGNAYGWTLNTGSGGPLTLAVSSGSPTITVSNQTATIGAVLAGTQGLVKTGMGTLVLTNANTYTGGTTISGGAVQLKNAAGFGSGDLTIDASGALLLSNLTLTNNITNNGVINVTGTGNTMILGSAGNPAALTGTGTVNVNTTGGGQFVLSSGDGVSILAGGTINVSNGATLLKGGNNTVYATINVVGTGNTAPYGALRVDSGTLAGNIVLQGDTTVGWWSGGGRTISGGIGTGVAGTSILTLGSPSQSGGTLPITGVISNGVGTLALVKVATGTVILSGTNTYSGTTTVSNGTLVVNGAIGPYTVTVAGGTLSGTGVIRGATTIQSGANLSPGVNKIGTLTITNALTLSSGSTTIMSINRSAGLNSFAQVLGVTSLTMGGMLTVTNLGGTFQTGDSFKLLSAASYTGAFSPIILPTLSNGLSWNTNGLNTNGTISVRTTVAPVISSAKFSMTNGQFNISGIGMEGQSYILVFTTSLISPLWLPLATNVAGANELFTFSASVGTNRACFYKVRTP